MWCYVWDDNIGTKYPQIRGRCCRKLSLCARRTIQRVFLRISAQHVDHGYGSYRLPRILRACFLFTRFSNRHSSRESINTINTSGVPQAPYTKNGEGNTKNTQLGNVLQRPTGNHLLAVVILFSSHLHAASMITGCYPFGQRENVPLTRVCPLHTAQYQTLVA